MKRLVYIAALLASQFAMGHMVGGFVRDTGSKPMPGVAVSDGYNVSLTDSTGRYMLESDGESGYVFVTTPTGYEPAMMVGNRPQFWAAVTPGKDNHVDFVLKPTPAKPLALIAIADMQISNRQGDLQRLRDVYLPDLNRTIDSLRAMGHEPVVLTLGDQTCEYYWYDNGFGLADFNAEFKVNAPVYHTMGNHDNDPWFNGDAPAAATWHSVNGPSYYSFNRDGCHFVVLDNIVYDSTDGSLGKHGTRKYHTGLTEPQLQWLAADLECVADKSAPLFLAMHGVLMPYPVEEGKQPKGKYRFTEGIDVLDSLLKPFNQVIALTGHAHNMHLNSSPDGRLREYNYAAACGTWWPARFLPLGSNFPLAADGSPWGYGVWDFSGSVPVPSYKGFGVPSDSVMRVYDLNKVVVDDAELSSMYLPGNTDNVNGILANIWAYEPGDKVAILEDGKPLPVRRIKAHDPLQIKVVGQVVKAQCGSVHKSLLPEKTAHMFRATASKPDSEIIVVHTDRFGRVHRVRAGSIINVKRRAEAMCNFYH